ncbi:MAG: FAD-binding oxidoreductase [Rhodospirillaceae bacterium]|jgi:FAD/FMN-containing dehydrogenase|nr:FAD-binding oxidoreductase [Rhodospirillaceae bacterium]MBT4490595.1 FAD-binding oxidoreductase [Rhodospirillaceae bacterium]MBT5193150.1 FAD-binding oxidoreductase [Rhodospirillaceae bacterium]MBT6427109.1 FAD-binding oxidoreductase [Rhodospirillaceae bacterium]
MQEIMEHPNAVADAVLEQIKGVVGAKGYTIDPDEIAPLCQSWRDNWQGWVPMVVKPANVAEVAAVVAICADSGTPIVPQGGNTGLTGGSQPHDSGAEIIISTTRMNKVREIDTVNNTMTVEAGCILAGLQDAAAAADRLFPLSLAAEGTCQIGGNLSTNAGGTQVLRYGNARNLVLGLEVVLPDGRIWDGLRGLRKDNTGYDLKQLFIGAEGTLGIITAAVLKLFPKPTEVQTALVAVPEPAASLTLLDRATEAVGEQVTAFELIQRRAIDFVLRHVPDVPDPFAETHPWYVLLEISGQGAPDSLRETVEGILEAGLEQGDVLDAVLAANRGQGQALWKIRESIPEAQNHEGQSVKHDVSVPLSRIAEFIERADRALEAAYPGVRCVSFGHIGDGNIHYNPAQPETVDGADFGAEYGAINRIVHDLIAELNGSISAEHGLGRLRRDEAKRYKSQVEMDLMGKVKNALDPANIMNPGKVI